ncbi:MAG TPA: DUF2914 domain-containing protein [Rhodospirillales bacterium]|nr:DUF2914 domain-containing protein [Rhodospirillales bacterium]
MKIKIVVRPEDVQAEAAAENARRSRRKRARWGVAALLGLIALSAAIAFFFIGRGTAPTGPEEQPVASAPAEPGADTVPAAPSEPIGTTPPGEAGGDDVATTPEGPGAETDDGGGPAAEEGAPAQESAPAPTAGMRERPPVPSAPASPPAARGDAARGETGAPAALPAPPAAKPSPGAAKAPVVASIPAKPEPGVVRTQLASRVIDREPADALRSPVHVGAAGRNVYYFNEFRNLSGQTVTHRWEYNGKVMAAVPFKIEGNRWRVYSIKRIGANQLGDWRVTTVDKAGAVLAQAAFRAE